MKLGLVLGLLLCWGSTLGSGDLRTEDVPTGQNLFVITLDGFRWQELFNGADSALLNDPEWTADADYNKALYWDNDPEVRRARLMPFFWNVIARKGQLHGNRAYGNNCNTSNFYQISYPGYNEIFTGGTDPLISSNAKVHNGNKNMLEYISAMPAYAGKVAAFASWDAFPYIFNRERSGFYLNAGPEAVQGESLSKGQQSLNGILAHADNSEQATRDDRITFLSALDYVKRRTPKVFFLGFSGTDDAGHDKSYDRYLRSANEADRMIGELWNLVQSLPQYRGNTTFLITTDHGRGARKNTWYNHGFFVGGSSQTWMALIGSQAKALGENKAPAQLYQKQIAGSMAWLLGLRTRSRNTLPLTCFRAVAPNEQLAVK
ncbi:MAG: phosphoglyceromutase [Chitinophagaceae bacterium]|nr:MAG: phosphoglyceromutase [Chitinophagaceae bacterium]